MAIWEVIDDLTGPASPFMMSIEDNIPGLLDPAINGTKRALEPIQNATRVKRVVLTSSFAVIANMSKAHGPIILTARPTGILGCMRKLPWDQARRQPPTKLLVESCL
jgi:nucleoside-diphosphate-sugar epimerase